MIHKIIRSQKFMWQNIISSIKPLVRQFPKENKNSTTR